MKKLFDVLKGLLMLGIQMFLVAIVLILAGWLWLGVISVWQMIF